jgi:hypothetical protein
MPFSPLLRQMLLRAMPPALPKYAMPSSLLIPLAGVAFQGRLRLAPYFAGVAFHVDAVQSIVAAGIVAGGAAGTLEIRDAALLIPLAGVAFQGRLRLAA